MAVAGIDPHRESFTVAVVNEVGVPLETVSWPATLAGFESGAEFLTAHGVTVVGVEGSGSNGRHVATALMVAGSMCVRCHRDGRCSGVVVSAAPRPIGSTPCRLPG